MGDAGDEAGAKVQVYVYDLSRGLARQFSPMVMGKQVDGIWHTSVVVYGMEYYYGQGIQWGLPGRTPFGTPVQVLEQGETHVPQDVLEEFLVDLSARFGPHHYDLLDNNCNNFSNELAQMLTGRGVPDHILSLPNEFRSSPLGAMLSPYICAMQARLSSYGHGFDPSHPHAAAQAAAAEAASASAAVPSPAAAAPGRAAVAGAATPTTAPIAAAATPGPGSTAAPATVATPAAVAHNATPAATAAALRRLELQETPGVGQGGAVLGTTHSTAATGGLASAKQPAAPSKVPRATAGDAGATSRGTARGDGAATPVVCALAKEPAGTAESRSTNNTQATAACGACTAAAAAGGGLAGEVVDKKEEEEEARKARVAAAIRREFDSIMAVGGYSANEAAALALKRVVGQS